MQLTGHGESVLLPKLGSLGKVKDLSLTGNGNETSQLEREREGGRERVGERGWEGDRVKERVVGE